MQGSETAGSQPEDYTQMTGKITHENEAAKAAEVSSAGLRKVGQVDGQKMNPTVKGFRKSMH